MKRTRDHRSGTSNYSVLCEKHLTADSFEPDSGHSCDDGVSKTKKAEERRYSYRIRATAEAASLGG